MTNMELINTLSQYDGNLQVLVEGSDELKVCYEECQGHSYLRIIKPWNIDMLCPAKEIAEQLKEQNNE
jgi:hypothetical protein